MPSYESSLDTWCPPNSAVLARVAASNNKINNYVFIRINKKILIQRLSGKQVFCWISNWP